MMGRLLNLIGIRLAQWRCVLNDIEGCTLLVPRSYLKADSKLVDKKTGGCGPGKLGDYLVPDNLFGESIFLACRIHDWMYFEVLTARDKFWADLVFLVNMVLIVNDGEFWDPARLKMAMKYYIAVSFLGGSFTKGD